MNFKKGDVVYYNGENGGLFKKDFAYKVKDINNRKELSVVPANDKDPQTDWYDVNSIFRPMRDFISNKTWERRNNLKNGDVVYYIGPWPKYKNVKFNFIRKDKDGSGNQYTAVSYNGRPFSVRSEDIIPEEEWKERYNVNYDDLNKTLDVHDLPKMTKNKGGGGEQMKVIFDERSLDLPRSIKVGDYVKYTGKEDGYTLQNNVPYEVLSSFPKGVDKKNKQIFALTVKSENGNIYSKESEDFEKIDKFKAGDKAYYIGDNINLKEIIVKGKPYDVMDVIGHDTIKIRTDKNLPIQIPDNELATEQQYQKNKSTNSKYLSWTLSGINTGPIATGSVGVGVAGSDALSQLNFLNKVVDSINNPNPPKPEKTETEIKMRIFKDTKSGALKWKRPYTTHGDWFRTTIKLEKPEQAYLRFDYVKMYNEHELRIYFHRNKKDAAIHIMTMKESKTLLILGKKIKQMVIDDDEDYPLSYEKKKLKWM